MSLIQLSERRFLPDFLIRLGIRRLLRERLSQLERAPTEATAAQFAHQLRQSPITVQTDLANAQHYEVPARFFELVLGSRLKYSCGWWPESEMSLDESEAAMLDLTCQRAELADGMEVLDLGCGWGSLSLWIAEHYPRCRLLAISNSRSQKAYLEKQCKIRGLEQLEVVTADVGQFDTDRQFDRVVSVEMFEHVRNYERLLERVASWLRPQGQLLVHIFCHRRFGYTFETEGSKNWMGRHFFSGGIMPALDLLAQFDRHLAISDQWWVSGSHYNRTCESWLKKLDARELEILKVFGKDLSSAAARRQLQRWRMFFMACAELFAYDGGNAWGVCHYRLRHAPEKSGVQQETRDSTVLTPARSHV